MKGDVFSIILLLLVAILLASCRSGPRKPEVSYREGAQVLQVEGMRCSRCESTIEAKLMKVEGVEWTRAEQELGQVAYTGRARKADVVTAIRELSYEVIE